jgi:hypothetical protein
MKTRIVLGLALAAGTACASAGASGGPRRSSDVITQEEIEASEGLTAFDVVQQLRPQFLRPAGGGAAGGDPVRVYIDGARRGGIAELRTVQRTSVAQIRYVSSNDATLRYGTGHRSGAIEVTTRR